jgi:hypothetical protein
VYCQTGWCAQAAYYARKAAGEPRRQGGEFQRRCVECGKEFIAHKANAKWCSKRCRILTSGRDASRRRGAGTGAVFYTDREIFERDGWRCHRCHKLVDRNVPRTHSDGASIDHIIPLSLGGIDAPSNVATAHWRCNREKGARGANDQLRLI